MNFDLMVYFDFLAGQLLWESVDDHQSGYKLLENRANMMYKYTAINWHLSFITSVSVKSFNDKQM